MNNYTKWVAAWGNATSFIDQQPCTYAKNLSLRYPVLMCFNGSKLRFHFSNLTGVEPITVTKASVANNLSDERIDISSNTKITFNGQDTVTIEPGREIISDEILFLVRRNQKISISIYLQDYTNMNAGVLVQGPLSKAFYAYGDFISNEKFPLELSRKTNWFYFLNTIDVLTEEKNHCLICYGDSITAQDWPDYLMELVYNRPNNNLSIIRRAVSGTRILRQYDCITYASYGLKGDIRFPLEINAAGSDEIIIQQGINDIIHPVGEEINIFRPMSDLPTGRQLIEGVENIYLKYCHSHNYKVYLGTLLPILGWRTYADFREIIKNEFNDWIKDQKNCIDFDLALRDEKDYRAFKKEYDSGDHLHPSSLGYKKMAECAYKSIKDD